MNVNNLICKYCDIHERGYVTITDIFWILGICFSIGTSILIGLLPVIELFYIITNPLLYDLALIGVIIDGLIIWLLIVYIYTKLYAIRIAECPNKKEIK